MKKLILIATAFTAALTLPIHTLSAADAKNIVEVAAGAGQFKTLVAAVKAAGLVETLSGKGPFTVFAPTDEAFAKLPAGTVESLLKPENKEKLAGILTESDLLQHLVAGRVSKDTIAAEIMERKVSTVGEQASSAELPRIFERGEVAIVVDADRTVIGILTKMDLIEMLAARKTQIPLRAWVLR